MEMETNVNIGIDTKSREKIAAGLSKFLADSYTLYLQTHYFHWNVTGPMFHQLHLMFETQYTELAAAVDVIAERIRSIGHRAPGTFNEFLKLSCIVETKSLPVANEMINILLQSNEAVVRSAREVLAISEKESDQATSDLVTQRINLHEKTSWMLRSFLEN